MFLGDHKFGKAAIEARQNFGEHQNDWFGKTIKSGEMESNFAIKRPRSIAAATTSALHNTPLTYYFYPQSAEKAVIQVTPEWTVIASSPSLSASSAVRFFLTVSSYLS